MTARDRAERLAAAVEHIAADGADDRVVRAEVLEIIRGFVDFDAYAFLLTDPSSAVGCSPLADVPDIATLPKLIRLKYLTSVNRWTALPDSGALSLVQATGGHLEKSLLWREHLAELHITDVCSVVFRDRFGWWGFLDLWRRQSRFSDEEVALLSAASRSITLRLRKMQAAGFAAGGGPEAPRGPGALILSPTLAIRAQTPQTQDWLAALVPPSAGRHPVPASAYNIAAQLLAVEAGVDAHPPRARVHLRGGTWLTLRADRLAGTEPVEARDIVVTMEVSSPTERREVYSRAHGLTVREDELLAHLADGADTRALARMMSISELTVQDHLKAVFTKTSTSSRRELLALSSGG